MIVRRISRFMVAYDFWKCQSHKYKIFMFTKVCEHLALGYDLREDNIIQIFMGCIVGFWTTTYRLGIEYGTMSLKPLTTRRVTTAARKICKAADNAFLLKCKVNIYLQHTKFISYGKYHFLNTSKYIIVFGMIIQKCDENYISVLLTCWTESHPFNIQ